MTKKIKLELKYEPSFDRYICPICGKTIAEIDFHGNLLSFDECEHITYEMVGNGCISHPDDPICEGVEELLQKALLVVQDGLSYYIFVVKGEKT